MQDKPPAEDVSVQRVRNFYKFCPDKLKTNIAEQKKLTINKTIMNLIYLENIFLKKVVADGWGNGVVKELSDWLKLQSPDFKGNSASNLWRMMHFFDTYGKHEKLAPAGRVLPQEAVGIIKETYLIDFINLPDSYIE